MHQRFWLIAAASLLAAAPAAAQNDVAAPVDNAANMTATTDMNVTASNMAVDNVTDPAAEPMESDLATEATPVDADDDGGFPWGIIGLVGLIGLLGRRK